jgi:hypothetical protein
MRSRADAAWGDKDEEARLEAVKRDIERKRAALHDLDAIPSKSEQQWKHLQDALDRDIEALHRAIRMREARRTCFSIAQEQRR